MGMAEAAADKGYARTTVADVIARAQVSRATFYQMFTDKEDCFRAAFELFARRVAEIMGSVLEGVRLAESVDPIDKLDRVITAYLVALKSAPALARTFLVEVYAAGPDAIAQRRESLEAFIDVVAETHRGSRGLIGTDPEQRFAVTALVGGASFMITQLVGTGDIDELLELREPILELARKLAAIG